MLWKCCPKVSRSISRTIFTAGWLTLHCLFLFLFFFQISVCTASTRPVGRSERSDTPSSILSSDSDIRFTRKLGSQYRCGCCIVAGFLLFLLVAAIAVYLACKYLFSCIHYRADRKTRIFKFENATVRKSYILASSKFTWNFFSQIFWRPILLPPEIS